MQAAQEAKLQQPRYHRRARPALPGDRRLERDATGLQQARQMAAMAVLVNQVTAKTKDSSTVVRRAWSALVVGRCLHGGEGSG